MAWTNQEQMEFESDVRDSILAGAAYFGADPSYSDVEEVDFDEFCDSFFEKI